MYNSAIYLHIIYKYQHVHNHEICSYITYNILVYLIHVYTVRYRITNEIKCEKTFWKMFLLNSEINVSSCRFSIVCLGRCPVQMKAEPQIQTESFFPSEKGSHKMACFWFPRTTSSSTNIYNLGHITTDSNLGSAWGLPFYVLR